MNWRYSLLYRKPWKARPRSGKPQRSNASLWPGPEGACRGAVSLEEVICVCVFCCVYFAVLEPVVLVYWWTLLFYSTVQPVRERHLLLKEFEWVRMMTMFLVVILPPRGLDPSNLRVALNLLSSSFSSLTFLLCSENFWQLWHALGLQLVLSYFYHLKSPFEPPRGAAEG